MSERDVCAQRTGDVMDLLDAIWQAVDGAEPSWPMAGTLGHVREKLAEIAGTIGAISADDARDIYGVII